MSGIPFYKTIWGIWTENEELEVFSTESEAVRAWPNAKAIRGVYKGAIPLQPEVEVYPGVPEPEFKPRQYETVGQALARAFSAWQERERRLGKDPGGPLEALQEKAGELDK